jgi:hypothetical protein
VRGSLQSLLPFGTLSMKQLHVLSVSFLSSWSKQTRKYEKSIAMKTFCSTWQIGAISAPCGWL